MFCFYLEIVSLRANRSTWPITISAKRTPSRSAFSRDQEWELVPLLIYASKFLVQWCYFPVLAPPNVCIYFTSLGTKSKGQPHLLASTEFKVCQRNDVNVFVIRYKKDIGEVRAVRFWHDNFGNSPSWFAPYLNEYSWSSHVIL